MLRAEIEERNTRINCVSVSRNGAILFERAFLEWGADDGNIDITPSVRRSAGSGSKEVELLHGDILVAQEFTQYAGLLESLIFREHS